MREKNIRQSLIQHLRLDHSNSGNTVIVEEFALHRGTARLDVAALNGSFLGFEIKSQQDSLNRLPRQVEFFSRVVDEMTLVCAPRHLSPAAELIPSWWGVIAATESDGRCELEVTRPSGANPDLDVESCLLMLWRPELQAVARRKGFRGVARSTRSELAHDLARELSHGEARDVVRELVKHRVGRRFPQSRSSHGG